MEPELIKKEPLGKGFFVYVSKHHSFGTDAVLLADFAAAKKRDRLADLGTGCGIIPLLLLRDGLLESAVGVDISSEAVKLAEKTARELSLDRFSVAEGDLKELSGKLPAGAYTLVTCNPPYKAPGAGIKNTDMTDTVARHEVACTLKDIISASARLLQSGGRLCMCHRPERLCELMCLMSQNGIEPKRLRLVCQRAGEEPWLVLVEGRRGGRAGLRIAPVLYIEENGKSSAETERIYGVYREGAGNVR